MPTPRNDRSKTVNSSFTMPKWVFDAATERAADFGWSLSKYLSVVAEVDLANPGEFVQLPSPEGPHYIKVSGKEIEALRLAAESAADNAGKGARLVESTRKPRKQARKSG